MGAQLLRPDKKSHKRVRPFWLWRQDPLQLAVVVLLAASGERVTSGRAHGKKKYDRANRGDFFIALAGPSHVRLVCLICTHTIVARLWP